MGGCPDAAPARTREGPLDFRSNETVYSLTDIWARISPDARTETQELQYPRFGRPRALVRAPHAPLSNGGAPPRAAQGRQHEAPIRVPLHGDRPAGEGGINR